MSDNLNPNINFVSDAFVENDILSYKLLIQISYNEVILLCKSSDNKLISFKQFNWLNSPSWEKTDEYLPKIFSNDKNWEKRIKQAEIVFCDFNSNLMPKELFDPLKINSLFEIEEKNHDNKQPKYDDVDKFDFYITYLVPEKIVNALGSIFENIIWINHASIFISYLSKTDISIYVHNSYFELVVISNEKVQIYNTFLFKTEKEFAFHLINTLNQIEVSLDSTVNIFGKINFDSSLYKTINRYLPNINLNKKQLKDFNASYFYSLFEKAAL